MDYRVGVAFTLYSRPFEPQTRKAVMRLRASVSVGREGTLKILPLKAPLAGVKVLPLRAVIAVATLVAAGQPAAIPAL